jgi:hypothetical protein
MIDISQRIWPRSDIKEAIFRYVRDNPKCKGEEINIAVYGPDHHASENVIRVHICMMNKRLRERGLKIQGVSGRGNQGYELLELKSVEDVRL